MQQAMAFRRELHAPGGRLMTELRLGVVATVDRQPYDAMTPRLAEADDSFAGLRHPARIQDALRRARRGAAVGGARQSGSALATRTAVAVGNRVTGRQRPGCADGTHVTDLSGPGCRRHSRRR